MPGRGGGGAPAVLRDAGMPMGLKDLRSAYLTGAATPSEVVNAILEAIAAGDDAVWIDVVEADALRTRCDDLAAIPNGPESLPLYGIPFAVKDNIDVCGRPTTAGCPGFSYVATATATVVALLERAGAILIGKTNLDQFATGLVGTRSPYGVPVNPHAPDHIPGGSSSGSAVAVARGLVTFALGTDTAGSGRVPAAMTGTLGLKPTRGLISTSGVVPACRSLDCVSVFASSAGDAAAVLDVVNVFDANDALALLPSQRNLHRPDEVTALRVGVPELEGVDPDLAEAFATHVGGLASLGVDIVPIDLRPFEEAGRLLYDGPWLAERLAALGDFVEKHPDELLDVTHEVLAEGAKYTAADLFRARVELEGLRRQVEEVFGRVDAIAVPSVPVLATVADVAADPIGSNARLGRFTNFANLLELAAVAVPAGTVDGVPVGFTLLGQALTELNLLRLADTYLGAGTLPVPPVTEPVALAVAGAHLRGQPLHHRLVGADCRLLARTTTAPLYRCVALDTGGLTVPALYPSEQGLPFEVEVYEIPRAYLRVLKEAAVPGLTIGEMRLADGRQVSGYRADPTIAPAGPDISHHGGWRAYLASLQGVLP